MVVALKFGAIVLVIVLQVFTGVDYINVDAKIRNDLDLFQKGQNGPVPSCSNTTYCKDTPYYPTEFIDVLLSNDENAKYLATDDKDIQINLRQNFDDDGESLCDCQETLVMPKTAINVNGNWLYVVNTNKITQTVRVESCVSERKPCKNLEGFGVGWQYLCKQTYAYRQMLVLTEENKLALQSMKLPSSCKCYMKFTGDPYSSRQGFSARSQKTRPIPRFRTDWE